MPQERFRLALADLATTRFAVSPGFELTEALRRVLHPTQAPPLHRTLLARIATSASPGALSVVRCAIPARGYTPDFLTQATQESPDAVLAGIAATPVERVASELDRARTEAGTPVPDCWLGDPEAARRLLADALTSIWRSSLAAEWPRVEGVLRADIATRARTMASDGIGAVLGGLHPLVAWDGQHLVRSDDPWGPHVDWSRGLLLTPSVMVWPRLTVSDTPEGPAVIHYPAINAEAPSETAAPEALGRLVGPARAAILDHLRVPARSGDVAQATGLSHATVSHHLRILRDAGLLTTARIGTEAWHAHTRVADDLLAAAPGEEARPVAG